MKNLLLALFFLPLTLLAQDSWVKVLLQPDQYASETSWEIYQDSTLIAVSPLYQNGEFQEVIVPLDSGQYNFVIYDAFNDGICCGFGEGWYGLVNSCGLEIFDYEFAGSSATTLFEVEPCLPFLLGCTNETAINYNPWATVDDESCSLSECPEGETAVSMALTLDGWPNETGFTVVNIANGTPYVYVAPESFNFADQYATYEYGFCVSLGFEVVLTDSYGDGIQGTLSGGTADGACVVTACGNDTIWELTDVGFEVFDGGYTAYSGAIFTDPCPPIPPVFGCMDDDYIDYDPLATAQDTCVTPHAWGCMDPEAFNYDSLATAADLNSPCAIEITIEDDGGDGWGNSKLGMIQGDQQWLFTLGPNEFSESWTINLDPDEEVYMYYFQPIGLQDSPQELAFQTLHNSVLVKNVAGDTLLSEGANPFFNNGQGALQPFASPEWNVYSFLPYCGDSCEPFTYGCTDSEAQNYDADLNTDDGSCYYQSGCMQAGYLEYYTQGYEADFDNGSCETLAVFGCMDEDASNYNEEANVDTECIPVVEGCMNPLAFNFNPAANTDDESCIPFIYGCTDPTMFNYDQEANTEDNSCIPFIDGCTDSNAFNYDPLATADNGSCIEEVEGCADPQAWNYEALVNVPDPASCLYEAVGCVTGLGEPIGDGFWLNDMCFAWVIQVDPYCCEENWDATCQETFNYCSSTGIEAILAGDDLIVYPNPVSDVLSINKNVDLDVFDSTGRIVVSETNANAIDASLWTPGMYTVRIVWNNRTIVKRVIK